MRVRAEQVGGEERREERKGRGGEERSSCKERERDLIRQWKQPRAPGRRRREGEEETNSTREEAFKNTGFKTRLARLTRSSLLKWSSEIWGKRGSVSITERRVHLLRAEARKKRRKHGEVGALKGGKNVYPTGPSFDFTRHLSQR